MTLPRLYLWDKRTLYLGPVYRPEPGTVELCHAAATLVVALERPLTLRPQNGKPLQCRSALFPADTPISCDYDGGIVACCFLDVFGCDLAQLTPLMAASHTLGIQTGFSREDEAIQLFKQLATADIDEAMAYDRLERLINGDITSCTSHPVDPRIIQAVALIKATVHENPSIEFLAESVGLSVPRLSQLFRQQTGVAIRRYRLWHRLYVTALNRGLGRDLTEAAQRAGFSDSSHCTHTFKSILGSHPAKILGLPDTIEIIIGAS
ncbi:MAG: helix-turn-helix transcriptional regulator [Hahellaceae bacterium]|nr:helix-turn-helix transcriptional regulator [Hahellaceae bacterium]